MIVYVAAALALLVALAGAGYQGFQLGRDAEKAANVAREAAAREAVEAQRQADANKARQTAQTLQANLTKQRSLNRDLGNALEAHIRAIPTPPAGCPAPALTDGLWDDWNRANRATTGSAGRSLPDAGGTSTPAAGTVPASGNPEPR